MSIKNQLSIEEDGAFISIKEKGGIFLLMWLKECIIDVKTLIRATSFFMNTVELPIE